MWYQRAKQISSKAYNTTFFLFFIIKMYFTPLKFGVISKLVHFFTKHAFYIINYNYKLGIF